MFIQLRCLSSANPRVVLQTTRVYWNIWNWRSQLEELQNLHVWGGTKSHDASNWASSTNKTMNRASFIPLESFFLLQTQNPSVHVLGGWWRPSCALCTHTHTFPLLFICSCVHQFVILQPCCLQFLLKPCRFHVLLITLQTDANGWWPARHFDVWLLSDANMHTHTGSPVPLVFDLWRM